MPPLYPGLFGPKECWASVKAELGPKQFRRLTDLHLAKDQSPFQALVEPVHLCGWKEVERTYLAGFLERDVASVHAMPGRSIHDGQKFVREQGSNAVTVPVQQHAPKIKNESFEFRRHCGKAAYSKSQ